MHFFPFLNSSNYLRLKDNNTEFMYNVFFYFSYSLLYAYVERDIAFLQNEKRISHAAI